MLKYFKNTGLIAIGLAAGILAGVQFATQTNAQGPADRAAQKSTQLRQPGPLPLEELRLLAEVFGQVKQSYVQPVDDKQLLTAAVKGMVSSLDPHSSYLDSRNIRNCRNRPPAALPDWALRFPGRRLGQSDCADRRYARVSRRYSARRSDYAHRRQGRAQYDVESGRPEDARQSRDEG